MEAKASAVNVEAAAHTQRAQSNGCSEYLAGCRPVTRTLMEETDGRDRYHNLVLSFADFNDLVFRSRIPIITFD